MDISSIDLIRVHRYYQDFFVDVVGDENCFYRGYVLDVQSNGLIVSASKNSDAQLIEWRNLREGERSSNRNRSISSRITHIEVLANLNANAKATERWHLSEIVTQKRIKIFFKKIIIFRVRINTVRGDVIRTIISDGKYDARIRRPIRHRSVLRPRSFFKTFISVATTISFIGKHPFKRPDTSLWEFLSIINKCQECRWFASWWLDKTETKIISAHENGVYVLSGKKLTKRQIQGCQERLSQLPIFLETFVKPIGSVNQSKRWSTSVADVVAAPAIPNFDYNVEILCAPKFSIFSYVDVCHLNLLRRVCTTWNAVISSTESKKFVILTKKPYISPLVLARCLHDTITSSTVILCLNGTHPFGVVYDLLRFMELKLDWLIICDCKELRLDYFVRHSSVPVPEYSEITKRFAIKNSTFTDFDVKPKSPAGLERIMRSFSTTHWCNAIVPDIEISFSLWSYQFANNDNHLALARSLLTNLEINCPPFDHRHLSQLRSRISAIAKNGTERKWKRWIWPALCSCFTRYFVDPPNDVESLKVFIMTQHKGCTQQNLILHTLHGWMSEINRRHASIDAYQARSALPEKLNFQKGSGQCGSGRIPLRLDYRRRDKCLSLYVFEENERPTDQSRFGQLFYKVCLTPGTHLPSWSFHKPKESRKQADNCQQTLGWLTSFHWKNIEPVDIWRTYVEIAVCDQEQQSPERIVGTIILDLSDPIHLDGVTRWYSINEDLCSQTPISGQSHPSSGSVSFH
ncbi:uncharacterized protein LOC129598818 [Paramacrobiotus metropolitanus]|uniref:uncharacterized protein LOC129598818 n=1 Tax=Paramacrobiotus metropolitanus TaxID=2943436 RepID=UPI0024457BEE|nr:uncharacterized protein LOC129598818 [Paramacrobiotus metropolitanus]